MSRRPIQPIRLAGQPVVSLEAVAEPDHLDGGGGQAVDLPRLLRLAGFDDGESAVLVATKVERVPRTKLPEYLGLSARQTQRLRRRVSRKLARLHLAPLDPPEAATILQVDASGTMRLIRVCPTSMKRR